MKKNVLSTILLIAWACSFGDPSSSAEMVRQENKNSKIIKSLAINRSLVSRFTSEYIKLKKENAGHPSDISERQLTNLKYKIQALHEDAARLRSALPENSQTREIVKDLLAKKSFKEIPDKKPAALLKRPASYDQLYQMHERALDYVAKNKLKEALKLYEEIILTNAEDDQAYIILGHLYLLSGQYEKSEVAFHNAVNIDPDNIHEITPLYENMILQNPDDDTAYAHLGYAYLILGEFPKAKDAFKDALSINPNNPLALDGLRLIANRQS